MSDETASLNEPWRTDLRRALAELPQERAPRSLRKKLAAIPQGEAATPWWRELRPAWAVALALLPLLLLAVLQHQRLDRQEQEIAQARRELVLALSYVEKANEIAISQIASALENGLARPVKENTIYSLQKPLEITREYEL